VSTSVFSVAKTYHGEHKELTEDTKTHKEQKRQSAPFAVYHAAQKNYRRPLPEGAGCALRREMLPEMMSPMASSQLGTLP